MPLNLSTIQSMMYLGQIMEPKSSQASSKPQGAWKTEGDSRRPQDKSSGSFNLIAGGK